VLFLTAAAALLAAADAGVEGAYLLIPKKEVFPSAGCCGGLADPGAGADRFVPKPLLGGDPGLILMAHYAASALLVVGLLSLAPRPGRTSPGARLIGLLVLVCAATVVEAVFVVDVLAPRVTGLPNHHCPYDLITESPVSVLAVAVFLGSGFCVAWACVALSVGRATEPVPNRSAVVANLCRIALFGFLAAFALQWVELART
jgi:hypothetical protein